MDINHISSVNDSQQDIFVLKKYQKAEKRRRKERTEEGSIKKMVRGGDEKEKTEIMNMTEAI